MCSKIRCVVFVVLVIVANLFFVNSASARDDWGYCCDLIIKYKMNDRLTMIIFPEAKFRDDTEDFYYQQYRFGVSYKAYDFLDLASYYHYSELQSAATGKWSGENRLIFDGILKWKMGGFSFSDKNRVEARYLADREKVRYRNELKIQRLVKFLGIKLFPFISNEVFYDLEADRAHMNWFTAGCFKKLNKNLGLSLFYRLESIKEKGNHWSGKNFIGTTIVVSF